MLDSSLRSQSPSRTSGVVWRRGVMHLREGISHAQSDDVEGTHRVLFADALGGSTRARAMVRTEGAAEPLGIRNRTVAARA